MKKCCPNFTNNLLKVFLSRKATPIPNSDLIRKDFATPIIKSILEYIIRKYMVFPNATMWRSTVEEKA